MKMLSSSSMNNRVKKGNIYHENCCIRKDNKMHRLKCECELSYYDLKFLCFQDYSSLSQES